MGVQELVDIMACQKIAEEDDGLEYLEPGEGRLHPSKDCPAATTALPPSDTDQASSSEDPGQGPVCTEWLRPQALKFEGPVLGKGDDRAELPAPEGF